MTGRILVVDDQPLNVKLLEAKLTSEYYDVLTASDGPSAIEIATSERPDLILLDVMMPGMDGFEVCRRLRAEPSTMHIPIVMVTALSDTQDRVVGLSAGADDFLTKPVEDLALLARVRSLLRFKVTFDELRLRLKGGSEGAGTDEMMPDDTGQVTGRILLLEDFESRARMIGEALGEANDVTVVTDDTEALELADVSDFDAVIISLTLEDIDGLRVCSQLRGRPATRHVPILALIEEGDLELLAKALDLGVTDYVMTPLDRNELIARVRTQVRRKQYQDRLRLDLDESVTMASVDELTKLHNRRYLTNHMNREFERAIENKKQLSAIMLDVDHFKKVNDTYGHAVGDDVLVELARRMIECTRASDLSARLGGEEFVVVMPETSMQVALTIAERLREGVGGKPFAMRDGSPGLDITISLGVAVIGGADDTPAALLARADEALYRAKSGGRNCVVGSSNDVEAVS
jgi:two-component system, cell cycle response regulator